MQITKEGDAFNIRVAAASSDISQMLLIADVHFDSVKCDRVRLKRVLDEAVKRDAGVLIFGDWLDVMGAKFDPRSGKSDIRPEYQTSNYFQDVVNDSVAFLAPYADRLLFICQGNHELAVRKRHEFDLLQLLGYQLKMEHGWEGKIGGYEGWIRFKVGQLKTSAVRSLTAFYTHGTGGSSPVTRGVIQTNRRQVAIDADLFISGHIHTQWAMPVPRRTLQRNGMEALKDVLHLQLGTYKESHKAANGWEAMNGFGPPSIGGYWLKMWIEGHDKILRYVEERTI